MSSRISRLVFGSLALSDGEFVDQCVGSEPTSSPMPQASLLAHLRLKLLADESLALELRAGNADALTPLFERHSPLLFSVARRILRNDAEAEDVVQQTFLDVFRSIQQFDPERAAFKTWLMMFAYQRVFNRRRSLKAGRFYVTDPFEDMATELLCDQRQPWNHSSAELRILIDQILSSLQPHQRQTIELIYYEGLTAEEVSARTGDTVRVVRHNLYRGLEKLRKSLFKPASPASVATQGGMQ